MDKTKRNVIIIATAFLFVLAFIASVSPSSQRVMFIYGMFAVIPIAIYAVKDLNKNAFGIGKKKSGQAVIFGVIALLSFYFGTLLIPGFSLGFPTLPHAVSDELRWFVVNIVAPVMETIFFFGGMFALFFFFPFFRRNKILAIFLLSIIFAMYHLGAYIIGFENLPSIELAFAVFLQNLSPFLAAFLFAFITGVVLVYFIPNLLFAIVFHLVNILIFYKQAVGNTIIT